MAYENSRQRRKRVAEQHNKLRAEQLALEKDRKENPEKYRKVCSVRESRKVQAFIATAMAISPNAFEARLLK